MSTPRRSSRTRTPSTKALEAVAASAPATPRSATSRGRSSSHGKKAGSTSRSSSRKASTSRSRATPRSTRTPRSSSRGGNSSNSAQGIRTRTPKRVDTPRTEHLEFLGVPGATTLLFLLPCVIYLLFFLCHGSYCPAGIPKTLPTLPPLSTFYSAKAFAVCIGWFLFQVLLWYIIPGETVKGVVLRNGERLDYKLNGWNCTQVTIVVIALGQYYQFLDLTYLYDGYLQLATAAIVLSFLLSIYLYITSFNDHALLALGGNSGNPIYDFFIGRELNPRIGSFDLKSFCELRPGLLGWALLNIGMALKAYQTTGQWNTAIIFVCLFQGWYVLDALRQEGAVLTTMDITTDGFGWMLAFGDLAWVPFTYTVQARFLVERNVPLSFELVSAILALQAVGYTIFRCSNSQKDQFRRDPNHPSVRHLKYIDTKRGTRLLVSGWWGVVRHLNYVGDWLMALSWCLTGGVTHVLPYFYAIYFAVLLVHRERRDDEACRLKYGADWDVYCSHVKYRLIPGVY